MKVQVKRIYEPAARSDGFRVLVDRLWPRGISKENAKLDSWLADLGPSTALRQWFNHDPDRWEEFQRRYHAELKDKKELVAELKGRAKKGTITLLYSAKDHAHNQAVVLQHYLLEPPAWCRSNVRARRTVTASVGRKRMTADLS